MDVVFTVVQLLLGLFFTLTGTAKLSDCHSQSETYKRLKVQISKLAELFPMYILDYELDPGELLIMVGWLELISGLLLAIGPPYLQEFSTIVLTLLTLGTLYSLLVLKEPVSSYAPSALCLGLLSILNARACYII